jgi:signal transduction histidine kinase
MRKLAHEAERRWAGDPRPTLERLQDRGREAMTDLRLLLGLLRDAPPGPPGARSSATSWAGDAASTRPASGRHGVLRLDVVVASLAVLDAGAWAVASHVVPTLPPVTPLAAALSCLAAATVVGRTIAPGPSAVAAGVVVVLATLVSQPVGAGLWVVLTVGGLAWSCAAVERRATWAVLGPVTLAAAFVHKHARYEPENLPITLVVLVGGVLTGVLVRTSRARAAQADAAARRRRAELDAAAGEARDAERRTVARDLHDVVSGGIGVIVLQAGAAQTLHGSDPERARRALRAVVTTCDHALVELDRLLAELQGAAPGPGSATRSRPDVEALVERMRTAGLRVERAVVDVPPGADDLPCWSVVHRVVQEALTNVLRHAPGSSVSLSVHLVDDGPDLAVDVVDDGPGPAATSLRGYGLVGLAERVEQAGGRLVAGAEPAGGFGVHARLPGSTTAPARAVPHHLARDVPG